MNGETRRDLIGQIAEQWTEAQTIEDLAIFYQETQEQYLDGLTDEELIEVAKDSGVEYEAI